MIGLVSRSLATGASLLQAGREEVYPRSIPASITTEYYEYSIPGYAVRSHGESSVLCLLRTYIQTYIP